MRRKKPILLIVAAISILTLSIVAIDKVFGDYNVNPGGSPGSGQYKSVDCNKSYLQLNNANTKHGMRYTLVECDSSTTAMNCKAVTTLGGKTVSSFDVWATSVSEYNLKYMQSDKSSNSLTVYSDSNQPYNYYLQKNLPIPDLILQNENYYLNLGTNLKDFHIDEILVQMGINKDILQTAALAKGHQESTVCSANQSNPALCKGYRIFVEPIFIFWQYACTDNQISYALTPTEASRLANSKGVSTSAGMWKSGNSLHTSYWDMRIVPGNDYYKLKESETTAEVRAKLTNTNLGLALNIIDPIYEPLEPTCEIVEDGYRKITGKNLRKMTKSEIEALDSRSSVIKYKTDSGETRDYSKADYLKKCHCDSFIEWYKTKTGVYLPDKTLAEITTLSNNGAFAGYDTKYPWNAAKYQAQDCPYVGSSSNPSNPNTCDGVEKYFKTLSPSIDLKGMTIQQIINDFENLDRHFRTYSTLSGASWTSVRYINDCKNNDGSVPPDPGNPGTPTEPPEPPKPDCTPEIELFKEGSIGTCYTGGISYQDSSNWSECIFNDDGEYTINPHKTSANGALTYKEDKLGSNYCSVYCTEELKTSFIDPGIIVEAGHHFVWPSNQVYGGRTCRTKEVKWDEFKTDLSNANTAMKDAYIDWQLERLKKEAIDNARQSATKNCDNRCDYNVGGFTCCKRTTSVRKVRYKNGACNNWWPSASLRLVCLGYEQIPEYYYETECAESDTPYDHGYTMTPTSPVTFMGGSRSVSSWCTTSGNKPTTDVAGKQTIYNQKKNAVQATVDNMKLCTSETSWYNMAYTMDPVTEISYSENNRYTYRGELEKTISYRYSTVSNNCTTDTVKQIKNCSGSSCPEENVSVKNCSKGYYEMTKTGTANFYLSDNVYRYVIKEDARSFHAEDLADIIAEYAATGRTLNYVDVGYGNLPVAYNTSPGTYGYQTGNGELNLYFRNLGHVSGSGTTMLDTILSAQSNEVPYGEYVCGFTVIKGLLPCVGEDCDDDYPGGRGMKVIYRVIDLNDPFPDINARGRATGANWCGDNGNDCSSTNHVVNNIITNNRDVDTEQVYGEEPMYRFVLTPAIVREIRNYNRTTNYNTYTNGTYDFVCDSSGGRCISDYLTELINLMGATGACTTNRLNNFYQCRY